MKDESIGDFWRAVAADRKDAAIVAKDRNLGNSEQLLAYFNIRGVAINRHSDYHITLSFQGVVIDFWPSKLKWSRRVPGTHRRNAYGLVKLAKELGLNS